MRNTPERHKIDYAAAALVIAGSALAWIIAYRLNSALFLGLKSSAYSTWIFLPAAVRILSVLLFGKLAAIGLVLGAIYTSDFSLGLGYSIQVAFLSGLAPCLAVGACRMLLGVTRDLSGLNTVQLGALAIAGATFNTMLLGLYLVAIGHPSSSPKTLATLFVGDVLGTAACLYLAAFAAFAALRFKR